MISLSILNAFSEMCLKVSSNTAKYKAAIDRLRRDQSFNVGDWVIAYFSLDKFPIRSYGNLHQWNFGPFHIFKKLCTNAYFLFFLEDVTTSPSSTLLSCSNLIVSHLHQMTSPVYHSLNWHYAVRWKDWSLTNCTWIDMAELRLHLVDFFLRTLEV